MQLCYENGHSNEVRWLTITTQESALTQPRTTLVYRPFEQKNVHCKVYTRYLPRPVKKKLKYLDKLRSYYCLTYIYTVAMISQFLTKYFIFQRLLFDKCVFTLDGGYLNFPTIASLVEFHTLNIMKPVPCYLTESPIVL